MTSNMTNTMNNTMNNTYLKNEKDKSNNKTYDMKGYMNKRYKSNQEYNNLVRKKYIYVKKANIPKNIADSYENINDIIDFGKAKFILDKIKNKKVIKDLFDLYSEN